MVDVLLTFMLSLVIVFCDSAAWFRLVLFLKSLFGSCTLYMSIVISWYIFIKFSRKDVKNLKSPIITYVLKRPAIKLGI